MMKFAIVLAAAAASAVAAPAAATHKDQKSDQNASKQKLICHTEMVTGSLIAKRRICKTEAEWQQIAQTTKQDIDDFTSRENGTPPTFVAGQPN